MPSISLFTRRVTRAGKRLLPEHCKVLVKVVTKRDFSWRFSRMNHDIRPARKRRKSRKQALSHPHPLLRHVLNKSMVDEKKRANIPTNPLSSDRPNLPRGRRSAPSPRLMVLPDVDNDGVLAVSPTHPLTILYIVL